MVTDVSISPAVAKLNLVRSEIGKMIVGQQSVVDGVLICLVAGGHVLLEGVPGLGKTTLLRTLGRSLGLRYSRIQFTPDLMPADIVGSMIMETDDRGHKSLRFQHGPIFSNLVLADEINRATPKTQSALLEAMQERTVTSGNTTHELESPFLVMATQNPIEMEGTYPLPEAQLDRFLMKIVVPYPESLRTIANRGTHHRPRRSYRACGSRSRRHSGYSLGLPRHFDRAARAWITRCSLVMATQPDQREAHEEAKRYIRYGSSPRGAQSLVECGRVLALLRGRLHLSVDDIKEVAPSVLRHRIILNFDAHADGKTPDNILASIISGVAVLAAA